MNGGPPVRCAAAGTLTRDCIGIVIERGTGSHKKNRQGRRRVNGATDRQPQLPAEWQVALAKRLEPGEAVLAWFEPDLNAAMRYARGLVVVTAHRLLAAEADGQLWQAWPLTAGT